VNLVGKWTGRIAAVCSSVVACLKVMKMDFWPREVEPVIKPESPARGLMVIAANMHGFANFRSPKARDLGLDLGWGQGHSMHNTCSITSVPNHLTVA